MLDTLVGMQRQIALGFFLQGVNRQWGKLTHAGMHAHICAYTYCVQGTVLGFERCVGVQHLEGRGRGHVSSYKQVE